MNRRKFIKLSGMAATLLAVGATSYLTIFSEGKSKLTENLASFYNPVFKQVASTLDAGEILKKLITSGVIESNGSIAHSVIIEKAKTDAISKVDNHFYSQTEVELYGLAYLFNGLDIVKIYGHDLMGGDKINYKVANVQACHEACQVDTSCTGYTFVKNTHPITDKHKMCYLKDGDVEYNVDENYISGLR
ncbi:MAG: hypothetical protein ACJA0H_000100 [Francisellaceae bacterium]|jgi:hypothetical protein